MLFPDNADQPSALTYHDLTPDGLPLPRVFVKSGGYQIALDEPLGGV